jgi:hypothetical protein
MCKSMRWVLKFGKSSRERWPQQKTYTVLQMISTTFLINDTSLYSYIYIFPCVLVRFVSFYRYDEFLLHTYKATQTNLELSPAPIVSCQVLFQGKEREYLGLELFPFIDLSYCFENEKEKNVLLGTNFRNLETLDSRDGHPNPHDHAAF